LAPLENNSRNQHFLTQGEQRLNALNPQASPGNLRIYSFTIIDRENHTLALESPNGKLIVSNLSLFDLFSFDVLGDGRRRLNFEALFHKYEARIEAHTKGLLAKLRAPGSDIKVEVIDCSRPSCSTSCAIRFPSSRSSIASLVWLLTIRRTRLCSQITAVS
jgi:hypothetical protein